MKNEVYNKWKTFGLLEGLNDGDAHALAERYEELGNYMLQNASDLNEHVVVLGFPALRRAFQQGLNEKYSPRTLCEKIKKEYDREVQKIQSKAFVSVDAEAEYCAIIADYFSRNKNSRLFFKK